MPAPGPLRSRRFLLLGLAVTLFTVGFAVAVRVLEAYDPEPPPAVSSAVDQVADNVLPLLLALPFGVLLDRMRRRRSALVVMTLAAAATTGAVAATGAGTPVAAHVTALVVVAALTSLTGQAQDAFLPSVVGRDHPVTANAVLTAAPLMLYYLLVDQVAEAIDPEPALYLILTTTTVLLAVAAWAARGVNATEEPPSPAAGIWAEATEGIRFVLARPTLRAITLHLAMLGVCWRVAGEVRTYAWVEAFSGSAEVFFRASMAAQAAPLLGALLAVLLHRRVGTYRLAWTALLIAQPFTLLLALSGTAHGVLWFHLGEAIPNVGMSIAVIALLAHRQEITPYRLLGRVGGVLVLFLNAAQLIGDLLETPARRLAELGPFPSVILTTALALAPAVPLLRAQPNAAGAPLDNDERTTTAR